MLKLVALGGLGEIGLNMMVVEYGESIFVIDSGLMFPETYMLGIDYVIPSMDYLKQNKKKIRALVLTHAHEDHIGAVPFFLKEFNVPVFATAYTLAIVRLKLEEHDLLSDKLLHEVYPNEKIRIDLFELEFIKVDHSVVDGVGLAIHTPLGTIIHTGDFRLNYDKEMKQYTNVDRFTKYCGENLLALLSDSTNIEKEGYTVSSKELGNELTKLVEKSKGRIIIALFASNIERIQQIIDIARINKRKIVFNGKSLETSIDAASKLGYICVPENMQIAIEDIDSQADKKIMMITTGSQGEPMSALARIAFGTHKQINIKKGDVVILSSKFIPGNEKAIANIINHLYKKGADVKYEKIAKVHVSGHASKEELKSMICIMNPKFFIPIHGEYRHLFLHCKLANSCGIPRERIILAQNGHVVELSKNNFKISDKVISGRVLIDGKGIGDVGRSVLKERRIMSEEGLVIVNMAFDEETGTITYGPEIVSKGFVFETELGYLLEDAQCIVLEIIEEVVPKTPNRLSKMKSKIKLLLRQHFFYTIGRRPIILPFILEI